MPRSSSSAAFAENPLAGQLREAANRRGVERTSEAAGKAAKTLKLITETREGSQEAEFKKLDKKTKEELLLHVHGLMEREVNKFFRRFQKMLTTKGYTKEDIMSEAVVILFERYSNWDPDRRKAEGLEEANFNTYFFGERGLAAYLHRAFIRPYTTQMRSGQEISLEKPLAEEGESTILDLLADLNKNQEEKLTEEQFKKILKNSVAELEVKDPFLALILILRSGLGKDFLTDWINNFDYKKYIKGSEVVNLTEFNRLKKFVSDEEVSGLDYDEEMTLQRLGDIFNLSREGVHQKEKQGKELLKKILEKKINTIV